MRVRRQQVEAVRMPLDVPGGEGQEVAHRTAVLAGVPQVDRQAGSGDDHGQRPRPAAFVPAGDRAFELFGQSVHGGRVC